MDTVFVSWVELVEALHSVHTVPRRLTAMPFSMRQQKLDKLCRGYKVLRPRLTKYCRDVSPVALTPMVRRYAGRVDIPGDVASSDGEAERGRRVAADGDAPDVARLVLDRPDQLRVDAAAARVADVEDQQALNGR